MCYKHLFAIRHVGELRVIKYKFISPCVERLYIIRCYFEFRPLHFEVLFFILLYSQHTAFLIPPGTSPPSEGLGEAVFLPPFFIQSAYDSMAEDNHVRGERICL